MRLTLEDLDKYAATLPGEKIRRTFEAKVRIGSTAKIIFKTTNYDAFVRDVEWFQRSFPTTPVMLAYIDLDLS